MTIQNILARTSFIGFSTPSKTQIHNMLSELYDKSPTAKTMLNELIAKDKTLQFTFAPDDFFADRANFSIYLDLNYFSTTSFISPNGKAVAYPLIAGLAHELVHAILGLDDEPQSPPDFSGETVAHTNKIHDELVIERRLSYYGIGDSPNVVSGKMYSSGQSITSAIVVPEEGDWNNYNVVDYGHIAKSKDLLIGNSKTNFLQSGDGNDFLHGNGGNDKLDGGADNDSLFGGDGDDTYIFSAGIDTVDDTGEGDIIDGYEGEAVEDGEGSGVYELNGAKVTQAGGGLLIERGADKVNLLNWEEGDYGITLEKKDKPDDDVENDLQGNSGKGDMWGTKSPIALDINKSGKIETVALVSSKTYFDIDNDGFSENVEWISPTDGWLVRDVNANGRIDNQNELFGDGGGLKAYQKLAALNTNNTGTSANIINSADSSWISLRVWIDANSNGVSETAELKTLDSLGITSLSLESAAGSLKSTFVRDGVTYNAQDIFVAVDQLDSWYKGTANEITSASLALPRSRGYGDVKSLHYAASSSAALMTKLQALDNVATSGLESYYTKLEEMIEEWTGTSSVVRSSMSPFLDARHATILEKFSGMGAGSYLQNYQGQPIDYSGGRWLEKAYSEFVSELSTRFIAQGTLANVFGTPTYSFSDDALKFSLSHTQILTNAKASVPVDATDKNVYWSEIARTLIEYATDFGMTPTTMQAAINVAAGYSVQVNSIGGRYFSGSDGNDALIGNDGLNYFEGKAGADTLRGGKGNDYLFGDGGSDTYIYARGDGNDHVIDFGAQSTADVVIFNDIARSDVTFTIRNVGLTYIEIAVGGVSSGNGSVLLDQVFGTTIEAVRFSDGISMNATQIWEATRQGTAWNDLINGLSTSETLSGGLGNDTINGALGNDLIYGGDGNDNLTDYEGNNTVYGDAGNDILKGGKLSSTLSGGIGNDTIYSGIGNNLIYGDAGNDRLLGDSGRNTIAGGLGADTIVGSTGDEIFCYARGDGDDVINKASTATTNDVLELTNIARSGVTFSAVADSIFLNEPNSVKINITGGGSILLAKYLDGTNAGRISSLKFSDGVVLNTAQIAGAASAMSGTSANDTITGGAANDIIIGYAGADSLSGSAGNDSLYGGSGANTLRGGLGNDLLRGGEGSDTYFYAKGDGDDVIADFFYSSLQGVLRLENITRSEASFTSVDTNADGTVDSIKLNVVGGGSVTLQDQLNAYGNVDFFNIIFSNGTTMTSAQIKAAIPASTTPPITGTTGDDTLFGDSGNNNIAGLGGNDQLIGGDGNDSLSGDTGNDTIWGEAGNDTITGGVGTDYLVGGNGIDRFTFNKGDTGIGNNIDEIADFNRAQGDKIALLGYGLSSTGFKGTGAMASGGAIEFNYTKVAAYNYTLIRIDADNNGTSDQEIVLTGIQIDLVASDFQFV